MRSADPRFPVGRTRLETVGVVACAVIMTIATIEVIQSAGQDLIEGFLHGAPPFRLTHHTWSSPPKVQLKVLCSSRACMQ